eukprot:6874518-Prorocentrum_lima.AAC.1
MGGGRPSAFPLWCGGALLHQGRLDPQRPSGSCQDLRGHGGQPLLGLGKGLRACRPCLLVGRMWPCRAGRAPGSASLRALWRSPSASAWRHCWPVLRCSFLGACWVLLCAGA